MLIILVGGWYLLFCHKETLLTSKSPNKNYKITVKYVDPFFFGSHEIYVYYNKNFSLINHKLLKTSLRNDGKSLDESNCLIQWKSDVDVTITFIGEEQPDEKINIHLYKSKGKIKVSS